MTASLNHKPPKTLDLTSRKVAIKSKRELVLDWLNFGILDKPGLKF